MLGVSTAVIIENREDLVSIDIESFGDGPWIDFPSPKQWLLGMLKAVFTKFVDTSNWFSLTLMSHNPSSNEHLWGYMRNFPRTRLATIAIGSWIGSRVAQNCQKIGPWYRVTYNVRIRIGTGVSKALYDPMNYKNDVPEVRFESSIYPPPQWFLFEKAKMLKQVYIVVALSVCTSISKTCWTLQHLKTYSNSMENEYLCQTIILYSTNQERLHVWFGYQISLKFIEMVYMVTQTDNICNHSP